jgi:hypothetical protein
VFYHREWLLTTVSGFFVCIAFRAAGVGFGSGGGWLFGLWGSRGSCVSL